MNYKDYKDTDLIPELKEWKKLNGDNFSVEDWLSPNTTAELFIAHSALYFPEFEEYLGGVFFADAISHIKKEFNPIQGFDRKDLENKQRLYNHTHIMDLFAGSVSHDTMSRTQVDCIAEILCEVWGLKLKNDFPHLNTHIQVYGLEGEYDDEVQITFWAEPKE